MCGECGCGILLLLLLLEDAAVNHHITATAPACGGAVSSVRVREDGIRSGDGVFEGGDVGWDGTAVLVCKLHCVRGCGDGVDGGVVWIESILILGGPPSGQLRSPTSRPFLEASFVVTGLASSSFSLVWLVRGHGRSHKSTDGLMELACYPYSCHYCVWCWDSEVRGCWVCVDK